MGIKFAVRNDTDSLFLDDRVREHLDLRSEKRSAIKDHILKCLVCQNATLDNFEVLKKCRDKSEVIMRKHS